MTKTECDLCGSSDMLVPLRDNYTTAKVKDICYKCEARVNKALEEMRLVAQAFVEGSIKSLLIELRKKLKR